MAEFGHAFGASIRRPTQQNVTKSFKLPLIFTPKVRLLMGKVELGPKQVFLKRI